MTIVRAPRPTAHFTQIRNEVLRDSRLSYKARGVLAAVLSRPDDWRTTSEQLAKEGKEGRDAVRSALTELEQGGYLVRQRHHDPETGRFAWVSTVYDTPHESAGQTIDGLANDGLPVDGSPDDGKPVFNRTLSTNSRDEQPPPVAREQDPTSTQVAQVVGEVATQLTNRATPGNPSAYRAGIVKRLMADHGDLIAELLLEGDHASTVAAVLDLEAPPPTAPSAKSDPLADIAEASRRAMAANMERIAADDYEPAPPPADLKAKLGA